MTLLLKKCAKNCATSPTFPQMFTFSERTMRQEKGKLTNYATNKKVDFGTRNTEKLASL